MASDLVLRFCRLTLPRGWELLPGAGAMQRSGPGQPKSVIVLESWTETPVTAADYAATQEKAFLQRVADAEVVERRTAEDPRLGSVSLQLYAASCEGGGRLLSRQLTVVTGPLVTTLTVTGSEVEREELLRVFDACAGSLEITARPWLLQIERGEPWPGRDEQPPGSTQATAAPHLHIAFPVPPSWRWDEASSTLTGPGGATLVIRQLSQAAGAPDGLFADALAAHAAAGLKPRSWANGKTPHGKPLWALESGSRRERSWAPPDVSIRREVFIDDGGVLAFRLDAVDGDTQALAALATVAGGYAPLPSAERRVRVETGWLRMELAGGWREAAPGLYQQAEPPSLVLMTQRVTGSSGVQALASASRQALRREPHVRGVTREDSVDGLFKGVVASRWALDFTDAAGAPGVLRAAWLQDGQAVCSILVKGSDQASVDGLYLQALDGFAPSGRKGV